MARPDHVHIMHRKSILFGCARRDYVSPNEIVGRQLTGKNGRTAFPTVLGGSVRNSLFLQLLA